MVTFIEVLDGPQRGNQYKVLPDVTLGRTQADILIDDPKVSSLHAKFEMNDKGKLVIRDLQSANGIKINGQKVKKVTLLSGVIFEIGSTRFRVLHHEDSLAPEENIVLTWRHHLRHGLEELLPEYPVRSKKISYTKYILQLSFIQGVQNTESVLISYLPRKAGFGNIDIDLRDTEIPKDAFELLNDNDSLRIRVFAPGLIKINDQNLSSAHLEEGDLISFGNTVIRIEFLEA